MNKKDWFINQKLRLDRGTGWLTWLRHLIYLVAGISIIDTFYELGLGFIHVMLMGVGILFLAWLIGTVDYKKGIWLRESEISTRDYNPYFKKLEADHEQGNRNRNNHRNKRDG